MDKKATTRPVLPDDLFRLRLLQGAQLSPDGATVAYALSEIDPSTDRESMNIRLLSVATGEDRPLTIGTARNWNPQWSPDGGRIAFVSARGGKPQVYTIAVDGGEARAITDMPQGVGGGPLWSPDGKSIAFAARPQGTQPRDPAIPYRLTRSTYRIDGVGYVDDIIQDLYVTSADGGAPRALVTGDYSKQLLAWSPDGNEILFIASLFPDSLDIRPQLWVADLNGNTRDLLGGWGYAIAASWTPDGRRVVFAGHHEGFPSGGVHAKLWVVDRNWGTPECRTPTLTGQVEGSVGSDVAAMPVTLGPRPIVTADGLSALVPVQVVGNVPIYRVALEGPESCVPVIAGERACSPIGVSNGALVYGARAADVPGDLYISASDGPGERRLTDVNRDLLGELDLRPMERLSFAGRDGTPIEGWVIQPSTGEAPYPTILHIHGGPHAASGNVCHMEGQALAGAGYAVLYVNYRGSMGYGDEFSQQIVGDLGRLEFDDLMAAVDHLVEKGIADPDRLGCTGTSYGGYLSCWIVGHTDRFKAASPANPITSFFTMFGVSHAPMWHAKQLGGAPHEIPEVYARCSPITYAHRCKTPTLLVQGEIDYCCPAEESEQFYAALKWAGCTVEMLRLPNHSHTTGPIPVRRVRRRAVLEWMNRYVMGVRAR